MTPPSNDVKIAPPSPAATNESPLQVTAFKSTPTESAVTQLIPLVELTPHAGTDRAVVERVQRMLEAIGKKPVVCTAAPGFIVPRFQALVMNEAARMVEQGIASARDVDRASAMVLASAMRAWVWSSSSTRLDDMVNAVSNSGRKFLIQIAERNFHQLCASATTVPAFIPTETGTSGSGGVQCMAKIWEQATMDQYIAAHKAVIDRYSSNPKFLGFMLEEVNAQIPSLSNNNGWQLMMKPQWMRMHQAIAANAPNVIFGNNMGWVPWADMEEIANAMDSYAGGMLGWPDTFLPG